MSVPIIYAAALGGKSVVPYPPTNPIMRAAINLIGGPFPAGRNNCFFMDELDNFPDWWTRILDAYQVQGRNAVNCGPVVAAGYHGLGYPDTNWLGNVEGYKVYLRELRRRGIRIKMAMLPDIPPYLIEIGQNYYRWNWELVERDLTPFYSDPELLELVEEWQLEWEVWAPNDEYVKAAAWARRIVGPPRSPTDRRIRYHNPAGHSAPGLGWEPLTEGEMWQNCFNAAGGNFGWSMQDGSYPDFDTFKAAVKDGIKHAKGFNGWPVMIDPNGQWDFYDMMEYIAYFQTWGDATYQQGQEYGSAALAEGAVNVGDGGPAL